MNNDNDDIKQAAAAGSDQAPEGTASSSQNATVHLSQAEFDQMKKAIDELSQLKDRFLRSAADFENAKKRLTKEREDFFKFALEGFIYELLPVLDNFELAIKHADTGDKAVEALYQGFTLIQKQLLSTLAGRGLRRLETVDKVFDPHVAEAVDHVVRDDVAEGHVIEEVLAGYELNGKLLRPAKVKVAHHQKPSSAEADSDSENEASEDRS